MDLRERTATLDRHPWELARADTLRRLLTDHVELGLVRDLLDVGAGDSWFTETLLDELAPGGRVVCWDAHYRDDDLHGAPPGIMRVRTPPVQRFDVMTALDVIEHVEDDDAFVAAELVPRLRPGGLLVVTVPAHPSLYGDHDRMLGHYRRYRPAEVRRLIGGHFDVVASGSFFTTLLLPRLAQVGLERLGRHRAETGVGQWQGGPRLTSVVRRALAADGAAGLAAASRGLPLPGLSTWVVATGRAA